ncbi:DNA repair protein XRCC1-like isoform X1 [Dreissena polymorpha]|uniref:DNA repair protein XRCC1-like isoform X1 n=1 Tax=Dreissena polymorpha TaxID=45954 RepID=UPI002264A9C6|nr:DNA repair protein XRCC1-like isoform X1 [Dreissena polymorpha]
MPVIKFQHVVSFSSEDKNNPADNLLKPEGAYKWKCATPGEKNVSIVIQLEKASQIHTIDIGNEGSAFVEVLVGKSSFTSDHEYQVLLVASSFMTPLEARNGTNRGSVRMFDTSQLSATAAKEKWDRVKIVCTQPFNKTSTYGLSFVKFHSPPEPGDTEEPKKLGFFKLKDDGNGEVKTGSIFTNRDKVETPSKPLSGAAAVRAASRLADSVPTETSPKPSAPRPAPSPSSSGAALPATASVAAGSSKTRISTPTQEKRKHVVSSDDDTDESENLRPQLPKQSTSLSSVASSVSSKSEKPPPLKKTKSEPPKDSPVKEFSRLMEKVTFVLSGYQNPQRGEIRDQALAMGAKYSGDWGKGCTHLICAFAKTPKYQQVKGKGRIVDKKWINDCYKQRKLLPWRSYRIGDAESPDEASDDEPLTTTPVPKKPTPKKKASSPPPVPLMKDSDDDDDGGGGDGGDSGEDTEDEIRRIKDKEAGKHVSPKTKETKPDAEDDMYDADTDVDEEPAESKVAAMETDSDGADSGLPELPDFFADKHFFIYGSMDSAERRLMTRFITAYAGELDDYMSEKVHYIVSSEKWDSNFDDALSDNPSLVFVKPKWVHVCHDKQKLVPHQPYIVVPDA